MKFELSSIEGKQAVAPTLQGKKGEKINIEPHASYPKPRVMHPSRKLPSERFVPTCHHYGKVAHIRPNVFNLKPRVHKNENSYYRKESEDLVMMMREVLSRLDKFEQSH
jgi:hypothetical protein